MFLKPASCSSACGWKCHSRSPLLVWYASPPPLHFLWEPRLSSGVSPWRARSGHVWTNPPKPPVHKGHKDTKVRTDNEVRRSRGPDPPGRRALTVTASSAEDVALTHQEKQWRPSREDVTKQIKPESSGLLWMKMKMCQTPLYCSSVPLTRPSGTPQRKLDFSCQCWTGGQFKCVPGVQRWWCVLEWDAAEIWCFLLEEFTPLKCSEETVIVKSLWLT